MRAQHAFSPAFIRRGHTRRFPVAFAALPWIALFAGLLVYLFSREFPPQIVYGLRQYFDIAPPDTPLFSPPFSGQLPSFLHALALLLLTRQLTVNQSRGQMRAFAAMFFTIVLMELVQADAVRNVIIAQPLAPVGIELHALADYAQRGTFDPWDVAAIILAALLTTLFGLAHARRRIG